MWFGPPMSGARSAAFERLQRSVGVDLVLVTKANLATFNVSADPMHAALPHLSGVHQADYLWAYLSHHYGGGFHDVKTPFGSWAPHFDAFDARPDLWLVGPPERSAGGVACQEAACSHMPFCAATRAAGNETAHDFDPGPTPQHLHYAGQFQRFDATGGKCCALVRHAYRSLVTVQAWIARPRTPLTAAYLRISNERLTRKHADLVAHPAPRDHCCKHHELGYPITWAELKGQTMHPLMYQYRAHVGPSMPWHPGGEYHGPHEREGLAVAVATPLELLARQAEGVGLGLRRALARR